MRLLPLVLCSVLLVAGCGRGQLPTAAVRTNTQAQVQYTQDERNRYEQKITSMIGWYDKNGDQAIASRENPVMYMHDSTYVDQRFNESWVIRTTIYFDRFRKIKDFGSLDANHDNRATRVEIVEAYLKLRDTNGDDGLGLWERFKAFFKTPSAQFEEKWYQETGRTQWFIYSPIRGGSSGDRPTPPPMPTDRPKPPLMVPAEAEE